MRIRIRHTTSYAYDRPVDYAAQLIRLTPSEYGGQRIRSWRVTADGKALARSDDGYGNVLHLLTVARPHRGATVLAEGEVETENTHGVVRDSVERLPPSYWLRTTPLTDPNGTVRQFAGSVPDDRDPVLRLHRLMSAVRARVDYVVGATTVMTTAAEALAKGSGVCQDHAHVFIAAARLLGVPARYVSGYLWHGGGETTPASHAWAEAYVDGLGWVGFDAANNICPTEAYVRVAIGLDYAEAAPVRGIRRGAADEALAVAVDVQPAGAQQYQAQQ
jgi:transglutaminase-like putative cysteine protease